MNCCDNQIFKLDDNNERFDNKVATKGARKCTDIVCLLLLIIMIVADVVIFGMALSKHPNLEYLYKGHDYNGNICDDRAAWVNISHLEITQCVSDCKLVTAYNPAESFEDHWCVPNEKLREKINFKFDDATQTYLRTVADLFTQWQLVLIVSSIGSIIISFLYLLMISINWRLYAYYIMNIFFGAIAGILLLIHGLKDARNDLTDDTGYIEIAFGAFISFLVLIIAYWLYYHREALDTEIELMAEAIEAIKKLWSAIVFCFFYSLLVLAFFAYWLVAALCIYSIVIKTPKDIPDALRNNINTEIDGKYIQVSIDDYKLLLIYHIIFALYIIFIFCYFGYLILSHVILIWYLEKNKPFTCCCCCTPKEIEPLNNMSKTAIINWIRSIGAEFNKLSKEFDIEILIKIINDNHVNGEQLFNKEIDYKMLVKYFEQQNEDKLSDDMIEAISDKFFELVRERKELHKKTPSQSQILCEAFATISFYHIGTASFVALLATIGIPDIPIFCKKYIYPRIRECECCKNNENKKNKENKENKEQEIDDDEEDDEKDGKNTKHTIEMTVFNKKGMYNDYKKKIFPLIEQKIQNLSEEYMVKAVIDKTMTNITRKHYYLANETPGGPNDGNDDEKYDNVEADHIISVIKDNIKQFKYENDIKEDIDKIIDKEIEKLNKQLKKKQMNKKCDDLTDSMKGRSKTEIEINVNDEVNKNYDKIRKEGLIFTSLYGTSFCYSSYRASKLERQNITRLADVEGFSQYNERFGRIGIASVNTAIIVICMFIIDSIHDNISSFIMPSILVFGVSYTIGYIFTMILEVTVSCLLFCVILNEEKWKKMFAINQGKIKQNVSDLANGLSAMITEHQLIMQLKEEEVNQKILDMNKKIIAPKYKEDEESEMEKEIKKLSKRLFDAKANALKTEEKLLNEIDGTMKLTQYLIDVILVENYFNKQYKEEKPKQEKARRIYAKKIFDDNKKYDTTDSNQIKKIKKDLYNKVARYQQISSFLYFYPNSEDDVKKIKIAWEQTVENLEYKLKKDGQIKNFKMSGAKKKGIERAFYKAFYSYHNKKDGFRYLTDILRCSFVFSDFNNLYKAFRYIHESMKDEFKILRVKDRFNTPSEPCGYRDFMINVLVKNKSEIEGIICEIQLHHQIFYDAKKTSHKMYKKTRLFETENGNVAYKYAVKYIRPIIGRFKVYPMDDEEDKIDILKIIEKKIEKLAKKYCQEHVIPNLDDAIVDIIKNDYDLSVLLSVGDTQRIRLPSEYEKTVVSVPENQQIFEEEEEEQQQENQQYQQ